MVDVISYGKAAAGKLSADAPCEGLGLGILCSGDDAEAWYFAGRQWATHLQSALKVLLPQSAALLKADPKLASQIVAALPQGSLAANEFTEPSPPLVALSGDIQKWVQAQQTLRDVSGILDTAIATLGQAPAPAPKYEGEGQGGGISLGLGGFGGDLVSLALGAGGLYLAYSLFFRKGGSNG